MQLYALDKNLRLISCKQAVKQRDYTCLECQGALRLRGGVFRQPHFYHLHPSPSCRQNGKSLVHLQVQLVLQNLLPVGECHLEYRFPSIGRVADAAWLQEKIIFEIQCSPIYPQEIAARNKDYEKEGFTVVWILHDARYNQQKMSPAETLLSKSPHYYTDIDENGEGTIYDQLSYFEDGSRIKTIGKHPIHPAYPRSPDECCQKIPEITKQRLVNWRLCFEGDFLDGLNKPENEDIRRDIQEALLWEHSQFTKATAAETVKKWYLLYICRPYKLIFQRILERACR